MGIGPRSVAALGLTALACAGLAAAAFAGVHKYDSHVSLTWEAPHKGTALVHAAALGVESKVRKCEPRRRVILFKQRRGPDRKLATTKTFFDRDYGDGTGNWGMRPPEGTLHRGDRLYVKVERKVLDDGDVCLAARSNTKTWPEGD
jgi:hypothetical protein